MIEEDRLALKDNIVTTISIELKILREIKVLTQGQVKQISDVLHECINNKHDKDIVVKHRPYRKVELSKDFSGVDIE